MKSNINETYDNPFEEINSINLKGINDKINKQKLYKENKIEANDRKSSEINENSLTNQNSLPVFKKMKSKNFNTNPFTYFYVKNVSKKKQRYFESDSNNKKSNLENSLKFQYKCEHPGCNKTFKTMKLKLNRHDITNNECRLDIVTLLNLISKTRNILKRNKKKFKNSRIKTLKKLYKKSIIGLPHYEYVINILGRSY